MANKSHHQRSSANRTLPNYADTSKLGEVEELEALGVLSRTQLEDSGALDYNPYDHLNTKGSRIHTAISMEEFEAHHHSSKGHQGQYSSHPEDQRCICGPAPSHGGSPSHHSSVYGASQGHHTGARGAAQGHHSGAHAAAQGHHSGAHAPAQGHHSGGYAAAQGHHSGAYAAVQGHHSGAQAATQGHHSGAHDAAQSYHSGGYSAAPSHHVSQHDISQDYPNCICGTDYSTSYSPDNRNAAQSYNVTQPPVASPSLQLGHGGHHATPATPPPDMSDIRGALERGESQMTVYNPEEIFTSMAPRTNCLEIRQDIIASSFKRDLDKLDAEEFEKFNEELRSFHESRRHDISAGGTTFLL